jgi:hypothetical protein
LDSKLDVYARAAHELCEVLTSPSVSRTAQTQLMVARAAVKHIERGQTAFDHGSLLRVEARMWAREGEGPAYVLAGNGARRPKMRQMAIVSLARLSV